MLLIWACVIEWLGKKCERIKGTWSDNLPEMILAK